MATTITLTKLDDDAEGIVEEFAERTGLDSETGDRKWVFEVVGGDHEIDVIQTLTAIDDAWTDHVGLEDPA